MAGVGCQDEEDRQRLIALGCQPEVTRVVGNLKYDAAKLEEKRMIDVPQLLRQLGVAENAPILVGGSTHRGEEGILADIYLRLRKTFPNLFLIVVPRHHERGREAGKDLASRGVKFVYRKEVTPDSSWKPGEVQALLVNVTGELRFYYEYASAVFVGKSLTSRGGQNPIEPAMMAKPIVFGKNMDNFQAITKALVEGQGALKVSSPAELEQALEHILADPAFAAELGRNAQRVVKENLGSIERTVDMIVERLDDKGVYVVPEA
jgi:3-deoxy-D-manno-octulosonic-acid transferase